MLYENLSYPDDLPFKIFFSNIAEENYHYHNELEMSFILRGSTHYKIYHLDYNLQEGELIIADSSDLHRIFGSSDDLLMLTIQVDLNYFSDLYPSIDSSIFVCEVMEGRDSPEYQAMQNKNKILKRLLTKIMVAHQQDASKSVQLSYVETLVSTLVEQFQTFEFNGTAFKPNLQLLKEIDMERYLKISDYIYTNYQDKISLETISEYLHLSPYYVSHLVKDISGLSFKNYLNYVRVEYSEKMLAEQVLTLTEICETCGFSSLTYFNKCFSTWHGKTPAQYRKDLPNCARTYTKPFTDAEGLSLLLKLNDSYRISINSSPDHPVSAAVSLQVDVQKTEGPSFRETCAPQLLLSSYEDLLFLNHYRDQLLSLRPRTLYLGRDCFRSLPAAAKRPVQLFLQDLGIPVRELPQDKQSLFDSCQIQDEEHSYFPRLPFSLMDRRNRLIYPNGLFSPVFHILRILANIDGSIVARDGNSMVIHGKEAVYLLIYKNDSQDDSFFNISFQNSLPKLFLMEQRFENNIKYRNILNQFSFYERIPTPILKEINSSFYNKKTYTLDPACQDLTISLLKSGVLLFQIIPFQ